MTAPAALLLHADDNVLVCCRQVKHGEHMVIEGDALDARADIAIGHKIARQSLRAGDLIIKYGMPIGSATQAIAAGEWVHLHNMKSNYLDAHTRAAQTQDRS